MAAHYKENILRGGDHIDTHASYNKWRHQESAAYAKHAVLSTAPKRVREADSHYSISDLADFLNMSRIEGTGAGTAARAHHKPILVEGYKTESANGPDAAENTTGVSFDGSDGPAETWRVDEKEVRCGPLLNYRKMEGSTWFGSVLIVTRGGSQEELPEPELKLREVTGSRPLDVHTSLGSNGREPASSSNLLRRNPSDSDIDGSDSRRRHQESSDFTEPAGRHPTPNANEGDGARYGFINGIDYGGFSDGSTRDNFREAPSTKLHGEMKLKGVKLYADLQNVFWRFHLQVEMKDIETQWEYDISGLHFPSGGKNGKQRFFVPAVADSMRIMFHSCNGFSVGTDEDAWSGPALWNDVLRVHKETPFHVMIGGGDQIYNDGIRVHGPLRPWSDIPSPKKRREFPFPESLRKDCDDYYVANYVRWYSTEPFASANGQIPQLNLWDDHDIIDGFGSYVSEFMKCDVFRGIGGTAHKYYMLFQHHLPPPISTYTTDAPQTMEAGANGVGADPEQLKDTFVLQGDKEDSSYIIGLKPGPYVAEHSRSIYTRLGARIAFFGIDARTERTRRQVNYPETYEVIFARLRNELGAAAASSSPIRHLIVLLGIPIAYPRLTWLENILSSPIIGPIKFLNKRFGVAGSLFNHFDGGVDLLDDLDDHYTARTHKKERMALMLDLQKLSVEFSVRVTILSGDVHLAACGRFYSNPKLGIPISADHRYMANIVSSAIVNKPPPPAIANLLARRNKLHHLDGSTDETLLKLFDKDPGKDTKTASSNHCTMPSRNWAMITENPERTTNGTTHQQQSSYGLHGATFSTISSRITASRGTDSTSSSHPEAMSVDECTGKDGHSPLHPGEVGAGSQNRAVVSHGKFADGSLDVCIRVEKDQHDKEGHTQPYGFWIPPLKHKGGGDSVIGKADNVAGAVSPGL